LVCVFCEFGVDRVTCSRVKAAVDALYTETP
jgi:hypothetical protein